MVSADPKAPAQPVPAHDGADVLKSIPGFSVIRKGGADGDPYTMFDNRFQAGDWLVFGSESAGLPAAIRDPWPDAQRLRLPMREGQRSLNLSNAVAVTVFEAWRQQGFGGATA